MRVLVTGLTGRMVGSDRLLYDYATSIHALLAALKELGHEVTQQNVCLGSRPEQDYDAVLVGLAPFNSLSSRHVFGVLHTVNCTRRVGFFADDWSVVNMATSMDSILRDPRKRLFRLDNRTQRDAALEFPLEYWAAGLKRIRRGAHDEGQTDRYKLLAPLFPWGDPQALLPDMGFEVVGWDPSNVLWPEGSTASVAQPAERERRWILATLQDHSPWVEKQKLGWPVDWLGNKRRGTPFVTEGQVCATYARTWGVLSPQYPREDKAGWWRMRYLHARDAGAVLYGGLGTGRNIGSAYIMGPTDIESANDAQLAVLAEGQRNVLKEKLWSNDRALQAVDDFVKEVVRA